MNSKAQKIIDESDINAVFGSVYTTIISNIQKSLGKSSGWIIDLVRGFNFNISKYNPLAVGSYTKLPKSLDYPRKALLKLSQTLISSK